MKPTAYIMFFSLLTVLGCSAKYPWIPPDSAWGGDVQAVCLKSTNSEGNSRRCWELSGCIYEHSIGTPLGHQSNWPTFRKIRPDLPDGRLSEMLPMSVYRARAERAGPEAVALFAVMEDVRHKCLVETGLRDLILDR